MDKRQQVLHCGSILIKDGDNGDSRTEKQQIDQLGPGAMQHIIP